MKFLNRFGLPAPLVRAIKWSDRPASFGDNTISVTTLLKPAQARAIEELHKDELETDVSEHVWRLLGQAAHVVVQRAASGDVGEISEMRFYWPLGEWKLTGQIDLLEKDGTLSDFKVTGTYSIVLGEKPEWTAQLNMQRWLLAKNGVEVKKLQIVAILRDWQSSKAGPEEADYPASPMVVVPVEIWSLEKTEQFILNRLTDHEDATKDPASVPCTSEERWERPAKLAVMQKGKKRALRLLDTQAEADTFILNANLKDVFIESRPAVNRRCEGGYCMASKWCTQFAEIQKGKYGTHQP